MRRKSYLSLLTTHQYPNSEYQITANLSLYQQNVGRVTSGLAFDQVLLDFFKTEYHVRLLWGNGKLAALSANDSDERHVQFAKVLETLADMCYD